MTELATQLMPMTITEYLAYADAHLNRMRDAIEFSEVGAALPPSAIYYDVTFD